MKYKNIYAFLILTFLYSIVSAEIEEMTPERVLELWKIEDDIRDCEREKSFTDIFIELARSVYFTNDKRSKVKLEINLLMNSNLVEEKSYKDYS